MIQAPLYRTLKLDERQAQGELPIMRAEMGKDDERASG
jgi:hypothetical protein